MAIAKQIFKLPNYHSAKGAMKYLGLTSVDEIYKAVMRGKLKCRNIDEMKVFYVDDLDDYKKIIKKGRSEKNLDPIKKLIKKLFPTVRFVENSLDENIILGV